MANFSENRIENLHDDGTSTKLSDTTAVTRDSDPTSENGENETDGMSLSPPRKWSRKKMQMKSDSDGALRGFHCVVGQQQFPRADIGQLNVDIFMFDSREEEEKKVKKTSKVRPLVCVCA
jgi:hypothetical protein